MLMRSHDEPVLRTVLPDISSEFAELLAGVGTVEPASATALDCSLARVRQGDHESAFTSAVPVSPDSEVR